MNVGPVAKRETLTGNLFVDVFLVGADARWQALEMVGVSFLALVILIILLLVMCTVKDCLVKRRNTQVNSHAKRPTFETDKVDLAEGEDV